MFYFLIGSAKQVRDNQLLYLNFSHEIKVVQIMNSENCFVFIHVENLEMGKFYVRIFIVDKRIE